MSCPLHRLLILVSTASIAVVAVVGTTTAAAITIAVSIVLTVFMVMPRMVTAGRVQIVVVAFVYHEAERPASGICLKALICLMENCWSLEL